MAELETYRREDGLYGWRLVSRNGRIVAVDGGQGFRDDHDAERGFEDASAAWAEVRARRSGVGR